MGLIDRLRGAAKKGVDTSYKARIKMSANENEAIRRAADYATHQRKEKENEEKRAEKEEAKRLREDAEYEKRQSEAERRTKQIAIRENEIKNKEKLKELNRRNLKTGVAGTILGIGKRAAKSTYQKPKRQRRQRRSRRYQSYDNQGYYPPPRRKSTMDDVDREFDKFF